MNPESLLIRTLDDLSTRINSHDEYEVLLASTLIRKLFLDDFPLVDQVNKKYKFKFEFSYVGDTAPQGPVLPVPDYWCVIDSLDPFFAPANANIIKAKRSEFFGHIIGIAEQHPYSVKDIVKFVANVMGGVHVGSPKSKIELALNKLREFYLFSDLSFPLEQIKSIAKIILKALRPLKYRILNLERFEAKEGVSIYSLLTFYPQDQGENYILEMGFEADKNRLAIFIDQNDELIFRLYDNVGRIFKVNAGHAGSSFKYGTPLYLACEIASTDNEVFLSIDTGTWSYCNIYKTSISYSSIEPKNMVLGSSYDGKGLTNMLVNFVAVYSIVLNINEKEQIYDDILYRFRNRKSSDKSARFNGNQYFVSENHSLLGKSNQTNSL